MAMSDSEVINGSVTPGAGSFTPPYGSWTTLHNTIERMAKEGGIPARLDRSYLSNLPGSAQTELLSSMKSLGLIDEQLRPTRDLEILVEESEGRGGVVKTIIESRYEGPLALGPFATQQQLEDEFRKYNISGSTLRKAVRFFLAAAKFADIPVSPHFRAPKLDTEPRKPRKPKVTPDVEKQEEGAGGAPPPPRDTLPPAMKHELIAGLVRELPKPGDPFPEGKQEAWFAIARATFKLIYKTDAAGAAIVEED
jgi:hypothetical protein